MNSYGVPQDYAKAREWYEKAAAKDVAAATYNLGVFYGNGYGLPQDYAKAQEWYEKAAAKDFASAMYILGVFYENGYGVTQDYVKAHEWFEKAAAKGDENAPRLWRSCQSASHLQPDGMLKRCSGRRSSRRMSRQKRRNAMASQASRRRPNSTELYGAPCSQKNSPKR
jgi:TPR repeat protein